MVPQNDSDVDIENKKKKKSSKFSKSSIFVFRFDQKLTFASVNVSSWSQFNKTHIPCLELTSRCINAASEIGRAAAAVTRRPFLCWIKFCRFFKGMWFLLNRQPRIWPSFKKFDRVWQKYLLLFFYEVI